MKFIKKKVFFKFIKNKYKYSEGKILEVFI